MTLNVLTSVAGANQITAEDRVSYRKALLEPKTAMLVHEQFALKDAIPKNGGTVYQFRRPERLVPSDTPTALTEGTPGNSLSFAVTPIQVTPLQYGDFMYLTDRLIYQGQDENVTIAIKLLGEVAGEKRDIVIKNALVAGLTNVQYAGGKTATNLLDGTCKLTIAQVVKAKRTLQHNLNKKYPDGTFVCLLDSMSVYDLQQTDTEWNEVIKHVDPQRMIKGELGTYKGIKFVETNVGAYTKGAGASVSDGSCQTTGGKADVYETLLLSPDAYGFIGGDAKTMKAEIIIKDLGSGGTADPLNQQASVGHKDLYAAKVLDSTAAVRIEHTVTA